MMALDRVPRLMFHVSWREEELWELGTYGLTSQGSWDWSNPTHFAYLVVCRNNCKSEQNGGKGWWLFCKSGSWQHTSFGG